MPRDPPLQSCRLAGRLAGDAEELEQLTLPPGSHIRQTMVTDATLCAHREAILRISGEHGASNVRVFGSVARGEGQPHSDIDLLVDLEPGRNLLDHVALIQDL